MDVRGIYERLHLKYSRGLLDYSSLVAKLRKLSAILQRRASGG